MFDCHFHLIESITPIDKLAASMDRHGIAKMGLMGKLCEDIPETFVTKAAAPLLRAGIVSNFGLFRKAIVAMYDSWVKDDETVDVGGKRYKVYQQPDNDPVMAAVAAHPDRFVGWIFVNPAGPVDPEEEIQRCCDAPGMIGVKAHSFWHAYPVKKLIDAAAICAEKGMPLVIHIGAGEHGDYWFLPEKFPDLNVIYAHAGIPYQREICDYAGEKDNVYVDLSGTSYVNAKISSMAIRSAGVEKCLFGTDGPYFHHEDGFFDFKPQLEVFNQLGLDSEEKRKIGGGNFQALLNRS